MPLIDKQIKDLNQTTITDSNVNEARKMRLKCTTACRTIMKLVKIRWALLNV